MDEGGELFQDFSSDASDFDDDVDWSFTDGESASVLHLMGEARSIKKKGFGAADVVMPSSVALDALVAADAPKADGYVTSDVSKVCSDEELLDELFPETKSGPTPTVDKPTELQVGEEQCQTKECEVEWALMALEEHEQLGQQSRSSITASNDNEFVSLFEEMYGSDAAIELSTPSPLAGSKAGGRKWENTGTTTTTCPESANACISSDISGNITDKVAPLDMAQLVYQKIVETRADFLTISNDASCRLCLPSHVFQVQPIEAICSFDSFMKGICCIEESLANQPFISPLASTQEERLELVLVSFDDKVGALPTCWKLKWTKIIDMLPLLAKMREQICPVTPAPMPTANDLQIDTTLSPDPTQPKGKTGSPLDGWATFHPDKMPVRRCEPLIKAVSRSQQPGQVVTAKKPRVRIRQYIPAKLRVRCKAYNPEEKELTFRPKINRKQSRSRKGEPKQQKENFTARMEKDIFQRRSLKLQHDMKRQELEQEEANSISAVNLIAKGSQRILLKNGMWAESLEERISRLAKHRTKAEAGESRSKKRRKRLEQRKQEAAAVASRACESLYQRGIEQRRREQERLREEIHDLEFQRNRPKISSRSLRVMKARILQELLQLCVDSQRTISNTEASHDEADRSQNDSSFVTFIQFSCALLYFGFVADLNTPWDGSTSVDNESKVTLLWHSWTVFSRDDSGVAAPKLAAKVLEQILFSVILGGRASDNSVLRGRDAQVLLRLYRANYYARKHTQLKSEPDDDRKQNRIKTDARSTEIKRSSSRRQRIRYSLHGKPIRQSDAPETDLLSERKQLLQEKIDQMREAKAKQELEGCTFHPHINPGPSEAAAQRTSQTPLQSPRPSSVTVSTFERLYSDAFQRQNNVLEKYLEAKQHREELEKRECTVHPSYVNGLTIEERLENLHVALAGNALPVDFRKKIDTMRTVTEMKARDEQMKQQRLQPAHFKKAKDGRTIVVPFQFATEIRSALSTELKKQRVKMAHRPRNHLMKGLRPPANEEDRIPAAVRSSREDTDIGEADLCLDVHLSPSETRQLYLNADDDPREVVDRFAQSFSLTSTQQHFLVQLVEARLEQFTNLQV